jgi:hypothetical protein
LAASNAGRGATRRHPYADPDPALTRAEGPGNLPLVAGEHVGRVSTGEARVSVALLRSPAGWVEPGQTPELDEYSAVLRDIVRLTHRGGALDVRAGQSSPAAASGYNIVRPGSMGPNTSPSARWPSP